MVVLTIYATDLPNLCRRAIKKLLTHILVHLHQLWTVQNVADLGSRVQSVQQQQLTLQHRLDALSSVCSSVNGTVLSYNDRITALAARLADVQSVINETLVSHCCSNVVLFESQLYMYLTSDVFTGFGSRQWCLQYSTIFSQCGQVWQNFVDFGVAIQDFLCLKVIKLLLALHHFCDLTFSDK